MSNLDFEQFEKDWKKRHKASLPRRRSVSSLSAITWVSYWIIVAAGAAIFSGVHTLPTAEMTIEASVSYRAQLALTAIIIVEFSIFGSAAGRHYIKWLKYLLIVSLGVALIGNLSSSYTAVAHNGGDWLNQLAGVLLSIIAPVTAFAAGEVLHFQIDSLNARRKEADIEYQAAWKEVEAKINAAYTKLEKEAKDIVRAQNAVQLPVSERTDGGHATGFGYSKRTDAKDIVRAHLDKHPSDIDKTVRELADILGVGKTTVSDVKRELLTKSVDKASTNDAL